MEDQEAASVEGVAAPPFSDLIREWLDEGDRLDETATATTAAVPVESRFQRIALRVRPALDRYRLFVLAGLGLIPFALFTLTHRGPSVPVLAVASISNVPLPSSALPPIPEEAPTPTPIASRSARPIVSGPAVVAPRSVHRSNHRPKRHRPARRAH